VQKRRRAPLVAAATIFALGFVGGTTVRPAMMAQGAALLHAADSPSAPATEDDAKPQPALAPNAQGRDLPAAYPAEVVRVIDGDTFQARVRVWPGLEVDTKVRLRGIDAPELRARCIDEHVKALAARAALETILAAGGVTVARIGLDKYGGRVDAVVATRDTADVSAALLSGGWARSYDGGRRGGWC
jgi:endonuclease YncB( thermonuclease family)